MNDGVNILIPKRKMSTAYNQIKTRKMHREELAAIFGLNRGHTSHIFNNLFVVLLIKMTLEQTRSIDVPNLGKVSLRTVKGKHVFQIEPCQVLKKLITKTCVCDEELAEFVKGLI